MTPSANWRRWRGVVLWLLLTVPPVRPALQATMTLQMLVQLPLLVLAGWWTMPAWRRRLDRRSAGWNEGGVSGLLMASLAMLVWMLPRTMDASLQVTWVAVAKVVSVPLLVGLPLAMSWPRAGFVVRGVFLVEAVATAFRLGWLYRVSPVRLCSNYLMGDQQRLGMMLLVVGAGATLWLAARLLFGHVAVDRVRSEEDPSAER